MTIALIDFDNWISIKLCFIEWQVSADKNHYVAMVTCHLGGHLGSTTIVIIITLCIYCLLVFQYPTPLFLPLFMINFHCYFAWIPTWQGLDGFQRYLILCSLDESSLSTGRVKGSSRYSRQDLWYFWQSHLNGESIYKEFGGVLLVMFRLTFLLQISFSDMLMPIIFRQNCQASLKMAAVSIYGYHMTCMERGALWPFAPLTQID